MISKLIEEAKKRVIKGIIRELEENLNRIYEAAMDVYANAMREILVEPISKFESAKNRGIKGVTRATIGSVDTDVILSLIKDPRLRQYFSPNVANKIDGAQAKVDREMSKISKLTTAAIKKVNNMEVSFAAKQQKISAIEAIDPTGLNAVANTPKAVSPAVSDSSIGVTLTAPPSPAGGPVIILPR